MHAQKLTFPVLLVLVAGLVNCSLAATWTGASVGDSWCTPQNWDTNAVPGAAQTARINPPPERGPVIDCDVAVGSIEGPKWSSNANQVIDVTGGKVVVNGQWRFANGGSGIATVNITGSPDITINGIWRASDSSLDFAVFNVSGGSISCSEFKLGDDGGGEINISGGTVTIGGNMTLGGVRGAADITITMTGGLLDIAGAFQAPPAAGGPGIVTINLDAGIIQCALFSHGEAAYAMDIEQGAFLVAGDVRSDILADVNAGYITAYGGEATVNVELFGGNTVVTASEPDPNLASKPRPYNGTGGVSPDAMLSWTPGVSASAHEVYLGTDFDDVNNAADPNVLPGRGRQDSNSYAPPVLLEFDTTYYWRVDEVSGLKTYKGRVWSFTTDDGKAGEPSPGDGASSVPQDADLSWKPGVLAVWHDVYFGTDLNDVSDANSAVTLDVYKGRQEANSYNPGILNLGTTYYWRVDEVGDTSLVRGDVWNFKTAIVRIIGHTIVYGGPDIFCGWPANNGVWTWGDYEILVSFVYGPYVEIPGHNLGSPSYTGLGRSLDGGLTWTMEDPPNFVGDGGTPVPSPGGINFAHPDFAWRTESYTSQGQFFISYDRGHNWQGPYTCGALMSHPELAGLNNSSRTDYVVNGPDDCLIGMSVNGCGPTDRAFMARTTDGGATFNFVSWINPEPCTTRGVMPSTVRISENKLVTTLRRKNPGDWIDAFVSYDNGSSWSFLSKVADTYTWNGNPPALVRLTDGRLACACGNRLDRTIEARISEDEGATWTAEIILRGDYQTDIYNDPDLGYCRMVQRPDGKLVTMYYWATPEHPTHHIAATIWDPGGTLDPGTAMSPTPQDGVKDVPREVVLGWLPGLYAASHDVYFGTDFDEVNEADTSSAEYRGSQDVADDNYAPAGPLELRTTYYWRIDEANGPEIWKGRVWSFTTADYIVVDDMEAYNDNTNRIYDTWLHGVRYVGGEWAYLNGAFIDLGTDPPSPVRGGKQSMIFAYFNDGWGGIMDYYSETERAFAQTQDWTEAGVKLLTLYFYGDPNNDANATEQMYVGLEDSGGEYAEVRYGDYGQDMNDIKTAQWQRWDIILHDFNEGGVALEDVNRV
ncbi:MAG TPA: sialidase family protein, partial [Sedimentisphaerales bacterium]|nr:sialidase family protein [Sedimentisphaerales bacterium]